MLNISLNGSFIDIHRSIIPMVNVTYKSKYDRVANKYKDCLFLTQNGDELSYTTLTDTIAIQSNETVDYKLPYPLTLDLASLSGRERQKQRSNIEIPECTLSNVAAFYDRKRPPYIRDSDFKTSVISENGKRASLEFIKPSLNKFYRYIDILEQKPCVDWTGYKWMSTTSFNEYDCSEISMVHKILFDTPAFNRLYMLYYPGDAHVLDVLKKIMARATKVGILSKTIYQDGQDVTYDMPVALFQEPQRVMIWCGLAQKTK